jgi:hypothetical protein
MAAIRAHPSSDPRRAGLSRAGGPAHGGAGGHRHGRRGPRGAGRRDRGRGPGCALRALGPPPVVAITAWRAGTLKARAYDGDLARIVMPPDADATWLADLADPARDLMAPMKGPLQTVREGDATLHRLAILLAKSAQLLPCVLAVEIGDAAAFADAHGLTCLAADATAEDLAAHHDLCPSPPRACRWRRGGRAAAHLPPRQWRWSISRSRSGAPTARNPSSRGCIPPASPATCWAA